MILHMNKDEVNFKDFLFSIPIRKTILLSEISVVENTLLTLAFLVQELEINSLIADYLQAQQFSQSIKT